jgi:hypothetical protein
MTTICNLGRLLSVSFHGESMMHDVIVFKVIMLVFGNGLTHSDQLHWVTCTSTRNSFFPSINSNEPHRLAKTQQSWISRLRTDAMILRALLT